jgi:PAS domain S-box-containing protein
MPFAFRGLRDRNRRVVQRPSGEGIQEQGGVRPCDLAVFVLFLSCLLIQGVATAQVKPIRRILTSAAPLKQVRRVLIFNDFGPLSSPGVALMDQAIVANLESAPYQIELYSEDLEATLFPDEASQREFREWYIHKYRDRRPDLIIAVGPDPLKFLADSHEVAFPNVPIVFCGSTREMLESRKLDSHFTGVWGAATPDKTLEAALRLEPSTKHVVVVGGVGAYDRKLESIAKQSLQKYESKLDITYLTNLDMPTLLDRLRHVPSNTIIYHTSIMQDAAGFHFIDASQSVPLVAGASNAPVFVVDDVDIGRGTVGGDVLSFAAQGQVAAGMAVRILNGENPQDIPIVKNADVYLFDWRALRRWGIKESNLPPDSVILYRQPTVWESHKLYVIGGISLILLEALLIGGLLWQRARRKRVESELAISNDRLRLTVEVGGSVGWDLDLKRGRDRRFGDLQTIFGITSDTYSGDVEDFRRQVHPADQGIVWSAFADARQSQRPFTTEFRVVRTDGTVRWITARGKFYYTDHGDAVRMLGMAVDITERKQAEEALTSLSGRLIEAQEEERRRIAREIHDDYSQRLAVLTIDLESLAEDIGHFDTERRQCLRELGKSASELGVDLHRLSHRLHSSALETLGLVAGLRTFCREFTEQQAIQVDFTHNDVPSGISKDASLCLFRILQEGLRNVKKHSGSDRAEVRLQVVGENLHLSIADWGRGFDTKVRSREAGIGIRSMEERLRLLGGNFQVQARPMDGTRIDAWLPFTIVN